MISRNLMNCWLLLIAFALMFVLLASGGIANASDIESRIRKIAVEEGVDADLAVAIARVESGLNPKAIGKHGELGVFQLRPKYHATKVENVDHNIRLAVRYLRTVRRFCEPTYKDAWIICYNVGPNYEKRILYPKLFPYYIKVMSEMNRIARGN